LELSSIRPKKQRKKARSRHHKRGNPKTTSIERIAKTYLKIDNDNFSPVLEASKGEVASWSYLQTV
jgi:hypothetical protein